MGRSLFIAGRYPPPLLEPVHPTLRPVAQPVDRPLESGWAPAAIPLGLPLRSLVFAFGDHVSDPAPPQQAPTLGIAIAFIQGHLIRLFSRPAPAARHANAV
jgi:hypothetical protein